MKIKLIIPAFLLLLFCYKKYNNADTGLVVVDYSFFIAGHVYGEPGINIKGVYPPFKGKFDFLKSDTNIEMGFFTGDIVREGTAQNWDDIDVDIAALGIPIHFAVGNHDISDRGLFEKRYGATYFSFIRHSDLFIVLDPSLDRWNIKGEQLAFLKNELAQNAKSVNNVFVLFHQLLWWTPDNIYKNVPLNSIDGRDSIINFWTEVEPLFHQLENNVVMCAGDIGAFPTGKEFMYHTYDNITFVASGMGNKIRDNIVIIDVYSNDSVGFRLIALNGRDMEALGELEGYEL